MAHSPDVPCLAVNHLNFVVEDFEATVARLDRLVGAQFIKDMPQPVWHAGLIYFAGIMVELFSPAQPLVTARYGDHYIGVEYQIADVGAAREAAGRRGIRIVRELGVAFHANPRDCFGISFEFFDGSFHTDPERWDWLEPFHERAYWADSHPLGARGLHHYGIAVGDLEAASEFLESFVGAVAQPVVVAGPLRTQVLQLADTTIELVSAIGPGPVRDHIDHYGDGIRSIALEVVDIDRARKFLADEGILIAAGDREGSIAFDLSPSGGLRCELIQS